MARPWRRRDGEDYDGTEDAGVERTLRLYGRDDEASRQALCRLWDEAFEAGRLAALNELEDRFYVCMK